jgi:hypothetical protein
VIPDFVAATSDQTRPNKVSKLKIGKYLGEPGVALQLVEVPGSAFARYCNIARIAISQK